MAHDLPNLTIFPPPKFSRKWYTVAITITYISWLPISV